MITRRSLITGTTALLAAPAIVRAESIMPVRSNPKLYLPCDTSPGALNYIDNLTASEVEIRWSEAYADVYRRTELGEYVRARSSLANHMTNLVFRMDVPPGFKPMRQSATHK